MRKLISGVFLVGAASATVVLSPGVGHAETPCPADGSTVADCVGALPIAGSGSGSGSSGRSFEVFDSDWLRLPPNLFHHELDLAPQKDDTPQEPIIVQQQ